MKKIAVIPMITLVSQIALASSVGIGYGVTSEFFKGDEKSHILPFLNYEYDNYFIDSATTNTLRIGYRLMEDDVYAFSLYAVPFGGYEIDGNDLDSKYKGIDDRDYQFMLGSEFKYYNGLYDVETILNGEIGQEGGKISLRIQKPYVINENIIIKPSFNFNYYNSSFIDYYFGIDSGEASTNASLNKYNGESGYSLGIGVTSSYRLTDAFSLLGFLGAMKFSNEIKNSPIVNNSLVYFGGVGIVYTF